MKTIASFDTNIWLRGLEQSHIPLAKGLTSSGNLSGRLEQLSKYSQSDEQFQILSIDPGEFINIGTKEQYGISIHLPIAYDLWYLWPFENIIKSGFENDEEYLNRVFYHFLVDLYPLKPLRSLLNTIDPPTSNYKKFFDLNGIYRIKQARFESILQDCAFKYDSDHPDFSYYCMYIAFPVGPLGVMRVQSILCESELEDGTYEVSEENLPIVGNDEFPPWQDIQDQAIGHTIIEKAYLKNEKVEFPAKPFNDHENYMHHYIRRWITLDEQWPIPGEFVGLIVRPVDVPHIWWFQKSSPFLYAGNWIETEYYTSGIIIAILEPTESGLIVTSVSTKYEQDPNNFVLTIGDEITTEKQAGCVYKIKIKDEEIILCPTDFYLYSINERVAIIKKWLAPTEGINFDWSMMNKINTTGFEINNDYMIIPISFYGR